MKGMNDDCITDNGIGEEGAQVMSKMMKTNTTLTSLNLCSEEEKKSREVKEEKIMSTCFQTMRLKKKE